MHAKLTFWKVVRHYRPVFWHVWLTSSWLGTKLKIISGILFAKWLRFMTSLIGSSNWCIISRPKNISKTFCISEEVGPELLLYSCQMILKQKSWCLIYYSFWSNDKWIFYRLVCEQLKMITPGISDPRHEMVLKLSPNSLLDKRYLLMVSLT